MGTDRLNILIQTVDRASSGLGRIGKSLVGLAAAYVSIRTATKAAGVAIDTVNRSLSLASAQAENEQRLKVALAGVGSEALKTAESFRLYSLEVQKVTKFTDDTVLKVGGMIASVSKLSGQPLQEATTRALNLAEAFGVDVTQAANAVGKALVGVTRNLSLFGFALEDTTIPRAERIAKAMEFIDDVSRDVAEAMGTTFAARVAQLDAAWQQLLIQFGRTTTESPIVRSVLVELRTVLEEVTESVKEVDLDEIFRGVAVAATKGAIAITDAGLETVKVLESIKRAMLAVELFAPGTFEAVKDAIKGAVLTPVRQAELALLVLETEALKRSSRFKEIFRELRANNVTEATATRVALRQLREEMDEDTGILDTLRGVLEQTRASLAGMAERLTDTEGAADTSAEALRRMADQADRLRAAAASFRFELPGGFSQFTANLEGLPVPIGLAVDAARQMAQEIAITEAQLAELNIQGHQFDTNIQNWITKLLNADKHVEGITAAQREQVVKVGEMILSQEQWNELLAHAVTLSTDVGVQFAFLEGAVGKAAEEYERAARAARIQQAAIDAATFAALDLSDTLLDAAFGADIAWGDFFKDLLKQFAQAIAQALILEGIMKAVGSTTGGVLGALGGTQIGLVNISLFESGGIVGHQHGGIVGHETTPRVRGDRNLILAEEGELVVPTDLVEGIRDLVAHRSTTGGFHQTNVFEGVVTRDLTEKLMRDMVELVERFNVPLKASSIVEQ